MNTRDEKPDPIFPDRLNEDLRALAKIDMIMPDQIEDDLRAQAAGHLAPRNRYRVYIRRAAPLAAAAGLAITGWIGLWAIKGSTGPSGSPSVTSARIDYDIDASGRIDILDAFIIARAIESGTTEMAWDVTADGMVNASDVDAVAAQAVTLSARSKS